MASKETKAIDANKLVISIFPQMLQIKETEVIYELKGWASQKDHSKRWLHMSRTCGRCGIAWENIKWALKRFIVGSYDLVDIMNQWRKPIVMV